ncbi:MAG: hypothetical protein P8127_08350 [Acidobacteriota bacterium]
MDRYDAILEQLKQAQNRGLDSVETRLDAIIASLDELIQSAKAAVHDARLKDAEELLPLADVEALLDEARAESEVPPPPPPGVTLENLRNLDAARSQSELLRALLPMMAEHVGRAVVLVIRDGVVSAWSGIGFADGEKLRSWHGGVAVSPSFSELMENSKPTVIDPKTDPLLSEWLQDDIVPDEGVLLPISLRGKLMGIVYVDHHGSQPWNIEAAQSLNAVACWLIDTLHHRMTVPTPTVAVLASADSGKGHAVETEVGGDSQDAIEFESVPEEQFEEQIPGEPAAAELDFEPEGVLAEAEDEGQEYDPSATVRIDTTQPPHRCARWNHRRTSKPNPCRTRTLARKRQGDLPACSYRRSSSTTRTRSSAVGPKEISAHVSRKTLTVAVRCSRSVSRPMSGKVTTIFRMS